MLDEAPTLLYALMSNCSLPFGFFGLVCMVVLSPPRALGHFHIVLHSFSIPSDDRSKASSKTTTPHSAIQSFLLEMSVSSPVLKVIQ